MKNTYWKSTFQSLRLFKFNLNKYKNEQIPVKCYKNIPLISNKEWKKLICRFFLTSFNHQCIFTSLCRFTVIIFFFKSHRKKNNKRYKRVYNNHNNNNSYLLPRFTSLTFRHCCYFMFLFTVSFVWVLTIHIYTHSHIHLMPIWLKHVFPSYVHLFGVFVFNLVHTTSDGMKNI